MVMEVEKSAPRGFTLVEILIVVVLLGILASIVIAQWGDISDDAKQTALFSDLQTIRSQIELYRAQHLDTYPTTAIVNQLTRYTNAKGQTRARPTAGYTFGPYLQAMPKNPYSGSNTVTTVNSATRKFTAPTRDAGWWYNAATGEFRANLTNSHVMLDGKPLNQM